MRGKSDHMKGAGGTREVDFTRPVQGGPSALGFDRSFLLPGGINLEPHFWIEDDRNVGTPSVWRAKYTASTSSCCGPICTSSGAATRRPNIPLKSPPSQRGTARGNKSSVMRGRIGPSSPRAETW